MTEKGNQDSLTIHNFNDRGYKYLLSFLKIFNKFIELFLPEWAERIDFTSIEKVNKSFISSEFKGRDSDVIYKTRFLNTELYFYILIEHQSSIDRIMPFRLIFYITSLWMDIFRGWDEQDKRQGRKKLPPVLPIVFYTGKKGWDVLPVEFYVFLGADELLKPYTPNFEYILVDLTRYKDEYLEEKLNILSGSLLLDKHSNDEEITEYLKKALSVIDRESDIDVWRAMMIWVYNFIYNKRMECEQEVLTKEVIESVRGHKNNREEVRAMGMTIAESLIEKGEKKGIEKGIEKGIKKGIIQEKHELILRALSKRFRDVPDDIISKIKEKEDVKQLNVIFDAIFDIHDIDQLYSLL